MRYLIGLAVLVLWPWSAFPAASSGKEPAKVRPVLWWSGLAPFSDGGGGGGAGQTMVLITDAKTFAKTAKDLKLTEPCPQVNFKEYFVLVVYKRFGLDLSPPIGCLAVDARGAAKIRGLPAHLDSMSSAIYSTTVAIFPRSGIKTVEGKRMPARQE
jgi:hypothetical protein